MNGTASAPNVNDRCLHLTIRRVTDLDAQLVYLHCSDQCGRIVGVYDPAKAGRFRLAKNAA